MKLFDIFDKSIRREVKKLLSKTKNKPETPLTFPSKDDTSDHGYRSGSSKRFGQG